VALPTPVRVTKPPTVNVRNPVTASIGTAVARWANNNPNRIELHIVNLGTNNLFISPEPSVSSTRGILVGPSGGNASLLEDEDGELVRIEWYGVAVVAAVDIYVLEVNLK